MEENTMLIHYLSKTDKISEKKLRNIKLMLIPLGIFLSIVGKSIDKFFPENGIADFISGMFMGFSIVVILTGIIVNRHYFKKRK